jgi:hypothetical protein
MKDILQDFRLFFGAEFSKLTLHIILACKPAADVCAEKRSTGFIGRIDTLSMPPSAM